MIAAARPQLTSRRVIVGIGLSMLAHVALLYAWRPAAAPPSIAPPSPLVLHLQPPPAPVIPAVPTEPAPAAVPSPRSRPAAPHTPRRVIAVAPQPSAASAPEVVVEAQPEAAPPPPKKFDLDAARATARIVGVQDAPNADDAPLARLKKREEANAIRTESKAAQAISAAKRGDCKDGLPGGLLAPLIMLTQKAGTGCKW